MSYICYFLISVKDYLGMFILILILIISIINTILLYLIIMKKENVLHNEIGDQKKNKGIIINNQLIINARSNNYDNIEIIKDIKYNANKSKPSNYYELNN